MMSSVDNDTALTLKRVAAAPAQTWNRLDANSTDLVVPQGNRSSGVYFEVPGLFERVECGLEPEVAEWIKSRGDEGRYHEVRAHSRADKPVVLRLGAAGADTADAGAGAAAADTAVMVRTGGEVSIVVIVSPGAEGAEGAAIPTPAAVLAPAAPAAVPASGSLLRVIAERDTTVHIKEFICPGAAAQHVDALGITADDCSRIEVTQYILGGASVTAGLAASLQGPDARIETTCRYYAAGTTDLTINYVVRHRAQKTSSELAFSGILDGSAKKTLRSTIDLIHGAKEATGAEAETVLILSDDITNKTVPVILCDEDDVSGAHGATIGSVSDEQLGYLAMRGLSRRNAEELFVRSLFEEALIASEDQASWDAICAAMGKALSPDTLADYDGADFWREGA